MTRRLLPLALLLCAADLPCGLFGNEIPPHKTSTQQRSIEGNLSLERAVEIALAQNPLILKAIQDIERTRGQVIEVRAQALPHISASGTYNQVDKNQIEGAGQFARSQAKSAASNSTASTDIALPSGQSITSTDLASLLTQLGIGQTGTTSGQSSNSNAQTSGTINDKSWRVAFDVRQVLYAGGQIKAALQIAKFTQDNTYWMLRDTLDTIISQVRTQFATILLNRALITVQEESTQLLASQLKDQQNRFDAGTVPRFNVLRAEVELSNVRPNLIRARNNYLIAELELAKTLGLAPGPNGKPSFYAVGELATSYRDFSLNRSLLLALERRPFLKVQRQNILIEAEQIKVALAGYKPRLDFDGGYEFRNSRLSDDLGKVVNGWFFGVTGSWQIFDGLATYGRTQQARAKLESAKVNYDDSVQQVELEVQKAYASLQQARETIQSQQKNVEQAIEALRLATERLDAGAGTQLDVLDARVALTRAQITKLEAQADYNKALTEFDRATATDTVYTEAFHDPISQKPTYNAKSAPPVPKKPLSPKATPVKAAESKAKLNVK